MMVIPGMLGVDFAGLMSKALLDRFREWMAGQGVARVGLMLWWLGVGLGVDGGVSSFDEDR